MKKNYLYFQPEYVSKFKCNGQACKAHCCRGWRIFIDKKTYKKYANIKPKFEAEKITQHIFKAEDNQYTVRLDEHENCPMLTEDNWCSIQRKYGEDYLSHVCSTYPRITHQLGDFFERALTLTCPVVATQVLLTDEPMAFEQIEVSEKVHSNGGRIQISPNEIPRNLFSHVYPVQFAAISILQERSLSIDERLIILGFFLDKLDEIISEGKLSEIENISAFFSSEEFLKNETQNLTKNIIFDEKEHMKIMFGTLETLYGGNSAFSFKDRNLLDAVIDALEITVDENEKVSLDSLVENYKKIGGFRKVFMKSFSAAFENYLVNEFFINLYPWKFSGSILHNYGIFLITYKMLEIIALSLAVSNFKKDPTKLPPLDRIFFAALVMKFANNIDHDRSYTEKISEYFKDKNDIISLMKSLLQN